MKKMKNKNRVLCVMQLPPPVHGVSMMNSVISESEFINERNLLDIFPLHYSRTFSEFTSGLSLRKIFRAPSDYSFA